MVTAVLMWRVIREELTGPKFDWSKAFPANASTFKFINLADNNFYKLSALKSLFRCYTHIYRPIMFWLDLTQRDDITVTS